MNGPEAHQSLPPELQRATPRPVRLTTAGMLLLAGALLCVPEAVVFGAWLHEEARRANAEAHQRLRATAVAEGVVTSVRGAGKRSPVIVYEFFVEGRKYAGRYRPGRGKGTGYRPGTAVRIAYVPENPNANWPVHYWPAGLPVWVAPAVAASLVAVAGGLLLLLRSQRRLLEEGRATVGVVTRVDKVRGKRMHYRVHYEFRLPSGAVRTGRDVTTKDPPAPGDRVIVIYDPENPRRQHRYPLPLVCVATD